MTLAEGATAFAGRGAGVEDGTKEVLSIEALTDIVVVFDFPIIFAAAALL